MRELFQQLQQNKSEILALANRFHADNVRVFGSVARGEEHDESDIDLLVEFRPGATLIDQVGLSTALSATLGRKVDVVSEGGLNRHLRQRVLEEALPL